MKITVFKYGESLYNETNLFADRPGGKKIAMSFCFYLIETGEKKILVDVGCDGRERYGFYVYKAPVELVREYGIAPEEITDIIVTHSHFDHVEAIGSYQNAVLHIQKNEYERGYAYIGPWENADVFEDAATVAENVRVEKYAGHTPDSCIVFAGNYLLCGDEAYYMRNLRDKVRIGNCASKERAQRFVEYYSQGRYIPLLFHDSDILPGTVGFQQV